jgi:glycosyltransferase involved in cell wall biosynthesis
MDLYNKKILLVVYEGNLGGAERQGLGISKILTTKYNCTVNVLLTYKRETSEDFKSFAKECHIKNILYFGDPYLLFRKEFSYKNFKRLVWSIKYLLRLRKGIRPFEPDIIIPFLNYPSTVSYYLYKMLPSVKFTFWHQLGLDRISYDLFERIAVKNTPCIIGNASNCLEMLKDVYKLNSEKLHVLPQYVSLEYQLFNKELIKNKYRIAQGVIVIGMVAHYREEKFYALLLQTFEKLCKKYDNIHLVFLGNIENHSQSQEKFNALSFTIQEKKLKSKISQLSGVKVQEILSILDIGVLVSRVEGTPNAIMEYMLYGLPVVSSNHPGCVELLKNSSFLIENNEEQLYENLEKLIVSENERKTEGIKNIELIKAYDMDSYINDFEKIMNETLNRK